MVTRPRLEQVCSALLFPAISVYSQDPRKTLVYGRTKETCVFPYVGSGGGFIEIRRKRRLKGGGRGGVRARAPDDDDPFIVLTETKFSDSLLTLSVTAARRQSSGTVVERRRLTTALECAGASII